MRVPRGMVHMTKSKGPRTEPWGTPHNEVGLWPRRSLKTAYSILAKPFCKCLYQQAANLLRSCTN